MFSTQRRFSKGLLHRKYLLKRFHKENTFQRSSTQESPSRVLLYEVDLLEVCHTEKISQKTYTQRRLSGGVLYREDPVDVPYTEKTFWRSTTTIKNLKIVFYIKKTFLYRGSHLKKSFQKPFYRRYLAEVFYTEKFLQRCSINRRPSKVLRQRIGCRLLVYKEDLLGVLHNEKILQTTSLQRKPSSQRTPPVFFTQKRPCRDLLEENHLKFSYRV